LGGVGLNLPTNGPLDYALATVDTNTLTYNKADITSGLTASTGSIVYVGKAHTITTVVRSFDEPENPAELSTVVVTTSAAHGFSVGDYVELASVAPTIDGVAYITAVTSTTFTFKQRFGDDIELDLSASDLVLPSLSAPVAIKVLKSYTQNADGSIHITSGTVDSTLIVGEISATEITIGSGEGVVRVGTNVSPAFQGIWAGSADPSTAEFSVDTAGTMKTINATIQDAEITGLEVKALKMNGAISFTSKANSGGDIDAIRVYDRTYTPAREVAIWDVNGIVISDTGLSTSRRIAISGSAIELLNADGGSIVALSPDGINASAITSGALPGGSNLIPNSSFELSPFPSSGLTYIQSTATGTAVNGDAPSISGTTPFSASMSMATFS
jgi:hypothetical protein